MNLTAEQQDALIRELALHPNQTLDTVRFMREQGYKIDTVAFYDGGPTSLEDGTLRVPKAQT